MSRSLLIVESPAKARTIRKYLGPAWVVKASLGHVKDLPKSKLGVAVNEGFRPEYKVIPGKKKILADLLRAAGQADAVFLALDPDREGEAIAWHIAEELRVDKDHVRRVLFNEITKKGIEEGLKSPLALNLPLYESQQARRILDRLVGYELSPILWKKVRRGLSAGRVQSVALRLIVDREHDIETFKPEEYWRIAAEVEAARPPRFIARFVGTGGKKVEISDGETAAAIKAELDAARFEVASVERKERRRAPPPPFITSRLQQEAARRFRFTAKRTMMIAQQLYEGVDIGSEGAVGLITYMRTDSVRLSADAVEDARRYIAQRYGAEQVPDKPNFFKSRKSAQDAHEAIRPTSVALTPEQVGKYLTPDQRKLYTVVWERFVACQMKPAVYDQTSVLVKAGRHDLRASGSVLKYRGWLEVGAAEEPVNGAGTKDAEGDDESVELPRLAQGDALSLAGVGVSADQKFTQPPARFTEGTLIRELEERGIGRPSTYATILSTIQDRKYVAKEEGKLMPSELGRLVVERLVLHFPRILDVDFTASMEETLDRVEEGKEDWIAILTSFYGPFHEDVTRALTEMKDVRDIAEATDEVCEKCGKPMVVKWGRNGRFLACTGYPECRFTRDLEAKDPSRASTVPLDIACEKCGKPMVRKKGRFGEFLACSGYPECKATRPVPTGIFCPKEGCKGELVERRTKTGRVFYGCSEYKASGCDFVVWGFPVKEACPSCGATFLVTGGKRKGGRELRCVKEGCGFKRVDS
ncbi:MAG: type I DNA topoisomerase [Deltaproteobacteria bacterium]|nr:type I DNA topoisomerase [Deltaproteobacteria bacterium]